MTPEFAPNCPLPLSVHLQVLLAHGGGGRLTHELVESLFLPAFSNPLLNQRHDGAVIEVGGQRLAFTTDSYVVRPLFFPGGDIGTLAVNGTVNDLVMCGARPRWISGGFIIEEGLPMETLRRVAHSMKQAAASAGVQLVAGDTKVVDKGKADGLFINTAGLGLLEHNTSITPAQVRPGDMVLLSGDLGRHGMAIMSVREGLKFDSAIESDCAPLVEPVLAMLDAGIEIHCLRDLTRGGLASALNEIAAVAHVHVAIDESAIPIRDDVRGACEILGLDPFYVANEGRFVAFISPRDLPRALDILHTYPLSADAAFIGTVGADVPGFVTLKNRFGVARVLDFLSGEQLPRIC